MEKLLHERLREWGNARPFRFNEAWEYFGVAGNDRVLCAIADEIERDYIPRTEHEAEVKRIIEAQGDRRNGCGPSAHHIMKTYAEKAGMPMENETITGWLDRWFIPRPRYEDGEPVQFGDEFIVHRYMMEPQTLTHIGIFSKEWLEDCDQYRGVAPVYEMNYCRPACDDGELPVIKRPTEVLDADGVRICKGDEGWSTLSGEKLAPVKSLCQDLAGWKVELEDGFWIEPFNFTHREPDSRSKVESELTTEIVERIDELVKQGRWLNA